MRFSRGSLVWLFAGLGLFTGSQPVAAAAPTLEHLYPAGGARGTTNLITAIGKQDPWPVEVWTDDAGLKFKAEKDKGKFSVSISPETKLGPHLVRLHNAQGASTTRFFLVSDTAEFEEKEPNDDFTKPQNIEKLSAIVNGRLEKNGDVDSFAVTLKAGQTLIASLDSYVLASTMDGMLRIVDTNGVQVAYNHDGNLSLDPFIAWQAPQNGTYIVQVMGFPYPANSSINFDGGSGNIYRLTLSTSAYLEYTFPTGVTRTNSTEVKAYGWNLPDGKGWVPVTLKTTAHPADATTVEVKVGASNTLRIPFSNLPEQTEKEPNDKTAEAQPIVVPGYLSGCIEKPADVDRYTFTAKKGQKWEIAVQSDKLGFPLDATLRIEDATGKELSKNDDANNSQDPSLTWTAPADGQFTAVVSSLLHEGGTNYIYRLSITEPQPSFRATVAANNFSVAKGKTNEFKLTVTKQNGHDKPLQLEAKGLPAGVTISSAEVPAKGGDIQVKLIAAADAKPFGGPILLSLKDSASGTKTPVCHELISRGTDNGVPQGYATLVIEKVEQLWLTVTTE